MTIDKPLFLTRFKEIEKELLPTNGLSVCDHWRKKQIELQASTESVPPILKTALVINWKESAMKRRFELFKEEYPQITSLVALKTKIDSTDAIDFCKTYLYINATSNQNPKYLLLVTLTNAFLDYQKKFGLPTEIGALRCWASKVDLANLKKDDFIGKLRGVGPGVVENIRLNLGLSVIKPDRHVIGVLSEVFGLQIAACDYLSLSEYLEIDAFYLDRVLFEYGKLKNISGVVQEHKAGKWSYCRFAAR